MGQHVLDERVIQSDEYADGDGIGSSVFVIPNGSTPTQVANPRRTSWRTFIQSTIGGLIALNAALIVLGAFLAEAPDLAGAVLGDYYGPVLAIVNSAVVVGAFISKAVALIMADPKVNAWITAPLPILAPFRVETTDDDPV